jgi:predicted PurR-regulated permease PerM
MNKYLLQCPTPQCEAIYNADQNEQLITCTKCNNTIRIPSIDEMESHKSKAPKAKPAKGPIPANNGKQSIQKPADPNFDSLNSIIQTISKDLRQKFSPLIDAITLTNTQAGGTNTAAGTSSNQGGTNAPTGTGGNQGGSNVTPTAFKQVKLPTLEKGYRRAKKAGMSRQEYKQIQLQKLEKYLQGNAGKSELDIESEKRARQNRIKKRDQDRKAGRDKPAAQRLGKALGDTVRDAPVIRQLDSAIQPMVKSFSELGKSLAEGDWVGAFAALPRSVLSVVESFNNLVSVSRQYVQAINPALMEQLNYVNRDLTAVIGTALIPIVKEATQVYRTAADSLLEPMQKLRPIIADFSSAIGNMIDSLSSSSAYILSGLMPTLQMFADVGKLVGVTLEVVIRAFGGLMAILNPFINVLSSVVSTLLKPFQFLADVINDVVKAFEVIAVGIGQAFNAIFNSIGGMFSGVGGTISNFGEALRKINQVIMSFFVVLTAMILRLMGITSAIDAMTKQVGGQEGVSTGYQAAQASVTGIDSFNQSLLQKAFTAMPVGPEAKQEENYLEGIMGILSGMKDPSQAWETIIANAIAKGIRNAGTNLGGEAVSAVVGKSNVSSFLGGAAATMRGLGLTMGSSA